MPIAYPLNSSMMSADRNMRDVTKAGGWNEDEIKRGLAHATPIVTGMAKMAPLLKAAQALSHYQGGHQRNVAKDPREENDPDVRIEFLRPQHLRGSGYGRGVGHINTKTGKGRGWDDVAAGRNVDSPMTRFMTDPLDDSPQLNTALGREYKSRTKW